MKLALIAGTGGLPPVLAAHLSAQGSAPVICEMRGFPSEVVGDYARQPFRIETLGSLLATLRALGVTHICMAGAVARPAVDPSVIDAATLPLVVRLQAAMAKGDDGTLREIVAIFEEQGFAVLGAHQVMPYLLPMQGVPTRATPPDLTDALAAARAALADMAIADLGQAVLVRDATVIAREDARGTAAMLHDFSVVAQKKPGTTHVLDDVLGVLDSAFGRVADWLSGDDGPTPAKDAILFKAPKPGQILQADMPMIGPETAHQAAAAGLAGIVIEQGSVMVLDLAQVVDILNAHGLFLWVCPKDLT